MTIKETLGFAVDGTPNCNFPSESKYDIPWLRLDMAGDFFDMPFHIWGAKARKSRHDGTILFYCDDYRFSAIWKKPNYIVESSCTSVGEVNFTSSLYTPKALVIHNTFKKRWLSRYWQENGIRVWVDLNVPSEFTEINLCGVPDGWNAFITHGYADRVDNLEYELSIARWKSGLSTPNLVVYGGGKAVRDWCDNQRILYIPEASDLKRGRYKDYLGNKSFVNQRSRNQSIQTQGVTI